MSPTAEMFRSGVSRSSLSSITVIGQKLETPDRNIPDVGDNRQLDIVENLLRVLWVTENRRVGLTEPDRIVAEGRKGKEATEGDKAQGTRGVGVGVVFVACPRD